MLSFRMPNSNESKTNIMSVAMNCNRFPLVSCILALFSFSPCVHSFCSFSFANDRPNIVMIVSDDQGYNDLGILGNGIKTPALDRLAKEGTRLTNFYVSWPACTPSRASLLTGRYPQRNGIYDMIRNEAPDYGKKYTPAEYEATFERIGGMDTREITIAKVLQSNDYKTGIFGKWDLGRSEERRVGKMLIV